MGTFVRGPHLGRLLTAHLGDDGGANVLLLPSGHGDRSRLEALGDLVAVPPDAGVLVVEVLGDVDHGVFDGVLVGKDPDIHPAKGPPEALQQSLVHQRQKHVYMQPPVLRLEHTDPGDATAVEGDSPHLPEPLLHVPAHLGGIAGRRLMGQGHQEPQTLGLRVTADLRPGA